MTEEEEAADRRTRYRGRTPNTPSGEFSRGFEEGMRNALREVTSLILRGHSASEIRLLAETRLAHMEEESGRPPGFLRSSLPTESLLPGIPHRPHGASQGVIVPTATPGHSYLFMEAQPSLAREFLGQMLARIPVVAMTRLPQDLASLGDRGKLTLLSLGARTTEKKEEFGNESLRNVEADPTSLTGTIRRCQEGLGPQLGGYLEAFEYLASEYGFENALRFVHWLNTTILDARGILVVSIDPECLDNQQLRLLKRDFNFLCTG